MRTVVLPLAVLLVGCSEYKLGGKDTPVDTDVATNPIDYSDAWADIQCTAAETADANPGITDECAFKIGGFEPVVEWEAGTHQSSNAQPIVADLDGDGMPEVLMNIETTLLGTGNLVVLHGDGTPDWERDDAKLGYGSPVAVGDLDGDGSPEIVGVREYQNSLLQVGDYTAVAWDADGNQIWESAHFTGNDFDYATAPIIADMEGDGDPEIVLGRVILRADGRTRGKGSLGRGSYGLMPGPNGGVSESSVPAVADLDLDGTMEVIVGNAMYSPDGLPKWTDASQDDAMISVANLDDDPEGEFVAITHNTFRAVDTDGSVMWGPTEIPTGNILAPAGIQDLDGDGSPEIVTAGGNELWCVHANGQLAWKVNITDESGATGASFFDFEGDGHIEVVYIDEVEMLVLDGETGTVKMRSGDGTHTSATMFDYPTIADIDADGHADLLVSNEFPALVVYKDALNSWAPARSIWNQHAYSVTNVYDDGMIPQDTTPNFATYNNYHSAVARMPGEGMVDELEAEILGTCSDDCDAGAFHLVGRAINRSDRTIPPGVPVSLYAVIGNERVVLQTQLTTLPINSGWTGEPMEFDIPPADIVGATRMWLVADDNGHGGGIISECDELNNAVAIDAPFCP